ncbi:MAG: response regulator [Spirochaetaceae bacterium]|jgi:DNA-binding response OmpR family regulator|nr:response regulator [Spirochaetaceae bacterium]
MFSQNRILIVDDEQINLELFELMLSRLGFVVEKAENGQEALEKVKEFGPDLIILDNVMPVMTGWEFTQVLKESESYARWRDIPVIMFSAINDAPNKVLGFELGIDDYITKPFNFSEILARIRTVLKNRELIAQLKKREARLEVEYKVNACLLRHIDEAAVLLQNIYDSTDMIALEELRKNISGCLEYYNALKAEVVLLEEEGRRLKSKEIEVDSLARELRSVYNT